MLFSMLRSFSLRRMSSIGAHSSEKASQYPPNSGSRAYRSSSRKRDRASSRAESSRVARKYSENRKWQKPGRRPAFADGGFPVGRHAPEDAAVSGIDKWFARYDPARRAASRNSLRGHLRYAAEKVHRIRLFSTAPLSADTSALPVPSIRPRKPPRSGSIARSIQKGSMFSSSSRSVSQRRRLNMSSVMVACFSELGQLFVHPSIRFSESG